MYSFYENPGSFYRRTGELQDILNKRETERLNLEKDPSPILLSKSMHMDKDSLQQYWQKVLEDNRRQEERNATLLRKLGKLEEHMTVLSTKTSTLNTLRKQYSSMMKIITSMSTETIPWPTSHHLRDPTRNDSEHLTKNSFGGHQSTSHLLNNLVYSQSPSQFQDSGLNQSVTPQSHRTITMKDAAIQTDSDTPLVCLRCGSSNFNASVITAPQDRLFRRVQSVSDLLGINGLPKPPTPYPRISMFSSTNSLTSQNQYATNLAETWKRNAEPVANRNYSYESLNFLSPIHSPTAERKTEHFVNHQQMLNEVLSALPSSNHYANVPDHNSVMLNAQQQTLFHSSPQDFIISQQENKLTSIAVQNNAIPRTEIMHEKSKENLSGKITDNMHSHLKEQIPENVFKTPLTDCQDIVPPAMKTYLEKQNNSETTSKDREIHAIPSEHHPFEPPVGVDQESHHVQNVVESISPQPDLAAKINSATLAETITTTGNSEEEYLLKETAELSPPHKVPIATPRTEAVEIVNGSKTELSPQHKVPIATPRTETVGSVNTGSSKSDQQTVVTSPKLANHFQESKEQEVPVLQIRKASVVESEKETIGIDKSFKRQEEDSSDEDDSFFKNQTSFNDTDAYKMLLGSVPPAKKTPLAVTTSSESSDDIENAFFSSVMTNPVAKEKQDTSNPVSSPKKTESAEIATESKKTGGAIPKAVSAKDRQRIAKKVMNLGDNSDSDIELPATKHDSDSDDFFS